MANIYVPIRAFGDFTITTAVIKNHFSEKLDIILPGYLQKLYSVLNGSDYYNVVDVIDMDRSPAFFELHKIKAANDLVRLTNEVLLINKHLKRGNNYLFDYRNRRLNVFNKRFIYPAVNDNIYNAKIKLLEGVLQKKPADQEASTNTGAFKKAIIFPGSRKISKVIDTELVRKIIDSEIFDTVDYSYHESENPLEGSILFSDVNGLKDIMLNYDMIISADSLPIHLAYFFNKPHFCIYNDYLDGQWITPYMKNKGYYTIYTGNAETTFLDIKNKLLK